MAAKLIHKVRTHLGRHSHVNWAMADQMVVSGSNFVMGIVLARVLGIEEFGVYSLAMLVILFGNMVLQSAVNAPMMSIGPKQFPEESAGYYGSVFMQAALFALLSAALTWIGVVLLSRYADGWNIAPLALPLAVNMLLVQMQDFLRRYFYTIATPAYSFLTDMVRYSGFILLVIGMYLYRPEDTMRAETVFWIASVFTLVSMLVVVPRCRHLKLSGAVFRQAAKRHWGFSKWLTASSLLQWCSANIVIIIAGAVLGTAAVGALKAAQSLLGVTHIVFLALENIAPIKAAKLFHEGQVNAMLAYLRKTTIYGMAAVCVVSAVFVLFADFWFGFLFGKEYVPYSYLVGWYMVNYLLSAIAMPLRFGLRAVEQTKIMFVTYAITALLSIAFAHMIVTQLGVTGVVMASIVIQLIVIAITYSAFTRYIHSIQHQDTKRTGHEN